VAENSPTSLSRREAVQPSLWDRLVDDLPGIVAETDRRRDELGRKVGLERWERILEGGRRQLERETDLDEDTRIEIAQLVQQLERRTFLEDRAVVVTPEVLREAVRRDIEALFNIERLESSALLSEREAQSFETYRDRLADFPEVRRSVINYGMPSFAGRTQTDFDAETLAREIRDTLAVFEPRLKRNSIKVAVTFHPKEGMRISIDGTLMLSPVAERFRLSTTVDLDNGRAQTRIEEV
jgi:type VI secretion system protein ImpF